MDNIFLVSHILLLFHSPKSSWNKSAKYEKLGKYCSYCTQNQAIIHIFWERYLEFTFIWNHACKVNGCLVLLAYSYLAFKNPPAKITCLPLPRLNVSTKKWKWFLWATALSPAGENHKDEWGLTRNFKKKTEKSLQNNPDYGFPWIISNMIMITISSN